MAPNLLVQEFLRTHSFKELEDAHGVCARPSSDFSKFSCNYDQIMSRSGDPLSEQCRGLVIRPEPDSAVWHTDRDGWKLVPVGRTEVLAWPMCRFYNHGDFSAAKVDWADPELRVYEKVDGTCIIVYWDPTKGTWCSATRSVSEADLPIHPNDLVIGDSTFSQLFLKALIMTREELSGKPVDWSVDGPDKVVHLSKEMTYVFELVSPHNQIVVSYPEPRAYLLAARHLPSGKEVPLDSIRMEHVRRPRSWPISSAVVLAAFVNSISPSELEGAVVCDSHFRRIKLKSEAYVLAHRSKDSVTASPRNALMAVILEKADDIVPLIPKDVGDRILKMQDEYREYCRHADEVFESARKEAQGSRKRFAELVLASGTWCAPYFNIWEGRSPNVRTWIRQTCDAGKLSDKSLDVIIDCMLVTSTSKET